MLKVQKLKILKKNKNQKLKLKKLLRKKLNINLKNCGEIIKKTSLLILNLNNN